MVFIISWGHATKQRPYGPIVRDPCSTCGGEQPFRDRVTYDMRHLMWVFRWVADRHYGHQCQTCGWAERIPKAVAQKGFKRPGILLLDRWGWAFAVVGFGTLLTWAGMGDAADHRRYDTYLAQPAVNDLYELDLARVLPHPEALKMYAIVRVDHVDAGRVIVRLPKSYYDGLSHELDDAIFPGGAAHAADYFTNDAIALDRAGVLDMKARGVIWRVVR